ncbi:MAG TPA: HAD family hydrolase [Pseudonocardiaceae bacterium]|nr:HAD family hydrolase [Pseudonocardiaceae bacterium]
MTDSTIAVLDIDGYRALRSVGETYPVYRLIGMGGDQVLTPVGGEDLEHRVGDQAREQQGKEVDALLEEIAPLPGPRDLLVAIKERGHRLVLASSGSSADVEASKPAPDLLQVALKKLGTPPDASSVMIGDSVWDVEAAKRPGCRRSSSARAASGTTNSRRLGPSPSMTPPATLRRHWTTPLSPDATATTRPSAHPAVRRKRPRPYPKGAPQPMTANETDPDTGRGAPVPRHRPRPRAMRPSSYLAPIRRSRRWAAEKRV